MIDPVGPEKQRLKFIMKETEIPLIVEVMEY